MNHITYGLRRPETCRMAGRVVESNETFISQYLEWKSSYTLSAGRSYRRWIVHFQEFTNKAPENLTIGDWTAFATSLHGRYAPKSVEYALNIIHNYLRFWHEQGRLRLPLYLARVPKARAESHQAITEDEYHRLIAVLKKKGGRRDLAIVMLLHDTGMRVGELVQLQLDQLEEDLSAVIHTEKTVEKRRVFWNSDTEAVLQRYLVQRVNGGDLSDWLFVGQGTAGEQHLTTRTIQRIITEGCRKAGIERHLSPHSFRHAFIHRLAALGVPDAVLAQLVGHKSPESIAHYSKLARPEAESFARKQFRPADLNLFLPKCGSSRSPIPRPSSVAAMAA